MKKNQMPLLLKETIAFDGAYGLKELRSLSFEPSVSITEQPHQVLIEGNLHLVGEGVAVEVGERAIKMEGHFQRVHILNRGEDDILEFEHYFPLTVSVASARISNIHQLDVFIDHIDYELINEQSLIIHADIMIDGVSKEREIEKEFDESEQAENLLIDEAALVNEGSNEAERTEVLEMEDTMEKNEREEGIETEEVGLATILEQQNAVNVQKDVVVSESVEYNQPYQEKSEEVYELPIRVLPNPFKEWNQMSDQVESFSAENEEIQTVDGEEEVEGNHEEKIVNHADQESYSEEIPHSMVHANYDPVLYEQRSEDHPSEELVVVLEGSVEEVFPSGDDSQQAASHQGLMSFVSALEDRMTTVTIHITQQDETPEMIAERHGVSVPNLMKRNKFESRAPFDKGKVVWIP
ncbi:hypothetical protein [Jeotgalibacillus soli]|uniref:hypothetical protein n=1 Tax=Jeotgalibacillus soli TaxID=889306 RepID=UPI0005977C73|nr:hypothetical protein [Jeotgalibacillus soli]